MKLRKCDFGCTLRLLRFVLRWNGLCVEWSAVWHCKGEDADIPYHVPWIHPVLRGELQTGGTLWSVQGNNSGTPSQHHWECSALPKLWPLPRRSQLPVWYGQRIRTQVGWCIYTCICVLWMWIYRWWWGAPQCLTHPNIVYFNCTKRRQTLFQDIKGHL